MPFFHLDHIKLHFEQYGTGRPLVGCHGLTGDLTQIRTLIGDPLGYLVTLWDVRGHGRTEPLGPSDAFSFDQFSRDLHSLLTHLGITRAVVVGVSMGAGIATRFALNWPEMVSGLILIRPAWLDRPFPEALNFSVQVGELLARYGATEGRTRFQNSAEYERLKVIAPDAAQLFCDQFDQPRAAERCVRLQKIPASCPIRQWHEVSKLKMPALVVGCEPDYVHPYAYAMEWSLRLPDATLVPVPPKMTDASQHNHAVRQAVYSFLHLLEGRR